MSLLLDVIGGNAGSALHVTLPVEMVLRDSTAPPNFRSAWRPLN
jgi:DNA-binding LacI/PurR family transcriptional regulator